MQQIPDQAATKASIEFSHLGRRVAYSCDYVRLGYAMLLQDFIHTISKHCLISSCCIELACLSDQALQWMVTSCSLCVQM